MDRLVALDPRFAPAHAAYYLDGLRRHTGGGPAINGKEGFPESYSDAQPLAFILERGNARRKIYIAAADESHIDVSALEWADVYGKVNLDTTLVPTAFRDRVVPIGPSHRVRIWGLGETWNVAITTHRRGGQIFPSVREHYRQHWIVYRRALPSSYYEPGRVEDDYVFYNSWLWKIHEGVNPPRAEFIRACQELDGIRFEGGFTRRRRNDVPGYEDCLASRRYSLESFLQRIKRSAVVFNNPAVHACHGWKLGEFLRMGKAIISLPPKRELPVPLLHGHHVHFVDGGRESMKAAVHQVTGDPTYRRRLESGARSYYESYLAPERVIGRLADIAFETLSTSH